MNSNHTTPATPASTTTPATDATPASIAIPAATAKASKKRALNACQPNHTEPPPKKHVSNIEEHKSTRKKFVDKVVAMLHRKRSRIAKSQVADMSGLLMGLLDETSTYWNANNDGFMGSYIQAWVMSKLVGLWKESHDRKTKFTFGDFSPDTLSKFHEANLALYRAGKLYGDFFHL